jgi:hypothetical protein
MRHPTPKSARPDDAESRPDARTDIVLAISEADRGYGRQEQAPFRAKTPGAISFRRG